MIELDAITTLCLACILYLIGQTIINHVSILRRICIPAPVIGGLIFAILVAVLDSFNIVKIKLDASFIQDFFMLAFFTTIGLGASLKLFKVGGKVMLLYFMFCGIMAFCQNVIGISLAKLLNIKPLLGLTAGSMSMEGGHGNAAAYGKTIQDMGIDSAVTAALAAATLGLVFGGLIGGPVVKFLIKRYNLKPEHSDDSFKNYGEVEYNQSLHEKYKPTQIFFIQFTILVFCMALGTYIGNTFTDLTNVNIPMYVGSMFVAVFVRNISEAAGFNIVDLKINEQIGDISLGIFLSLALMSIQLTEIYSLALPLIIIVLVQVVFMILFSIFVLFRGLGKDYDAAVMVGGFIGHGLGATPNAMANLDVITKKYGNSPKAYLVVPIVGAFLIDLIGVIIVMGFIQFFQ
ncbi:MULTISPECIES: sodium/glutamate symporter [Staphylococcus]|jgi:ESS family glutamate:Na+ symporter|uniref:sodium/glutamate symporter n=1 Tax=Staphylococcus TaxID=1279 RepID=UPI0001A5CB59|nr:MULTISPECIES: sodium/glutamate symporter [Staphylococcus]EEQ79197.1 sodium/glutamate symporter [Staphylococcus warneri L37603]MBO0377392.1 sodium/glutamate symporter [Staphylococcus warneri]MCI2789204.1 sodium/glutamate symporter [Staphylococcus warneri]MCJ1804806.1 sodium/glutamate symporter [Staphylococcus warneri]PTI14659.1 sodium/glutamate symporter [Staphylococcus warneri]